MTEILSSARMRALENAAIDSGAVSGLTLMERAGQGVVTAIFETWPDLAHGPRRAVILCGPGNNGGDGFVVARLLHARGWQVACHLLGDPAKLPPDARANHDRWAALGPICPLDPARQILDPRPDLVIDALFGIGLSRPLAAPLPDLLHRLATTAPPAHIVAIDLPSGLQSDSAEILGAVLPADLTVTFHRPKPAHLAAQGAPLCGRLAVVDIGL